MLLSTDNEKDSNSAEKDPPKSEPEKETLTLKTNVDSDHKAQETAQQTDLPQDNQQRKNDALFCVFMYLGIVLYNMLSFEILNQKMGPLNSQKIVICQGIKWKS